jgi:hypothetical protein
MLIVFVSKRGIQPSGRGGSGASRTPTGIPTHVFRSLYRQEAEVTLIDALSSVVEFVGKRAHRLLTSRYDTCRLRCGPEGALSGCEGLASAPRLTPSLQRL